MKVEGWLFLGCGVFFAGTDIVYWYLSKDPTGTTALAFAVGLAVLTGFYVLFTGRRLPRRSEDDSQGEIAEGTGEHGFFSPHSWWPILVALAGATAATGIALWLPWLIVAGVVFILASVAGLVFEYYVGPEKH